MCRLSTACWLWGVHVGCFIHVLAYIRWTETGSKDERGTGGRGGGTYLSPRGVRNLNKYLAQACQNRMGGGGVGGP